MADPMPGSSSIGMIRYVSEAAQPGFQGGQAIKPLSLGNFESTHGDFNVSFAPQGSMVATNFGERKSAGAQIRFGPSEKQALREENTWYLFAGADGQAISWDMGRTPFDVAEFVKLKDKVTIGDFQAGFAYRMGPTQMSFGYTRRSYKLEDLKDTEHFAAFTIGWKR
jgi:hypothetical protein